MINRSTSKISCFMVLLYVLLGVQSALAAPADDFVTTWKTDNPGTSNTTSITVPMVGGPYDVDWDNNGTFDEFGLTGSRTHNYDAAGTYTIRIRGTYDAIQFAGGGDSEKILSLDQWGTNVWQSMNRAFSGARYLQVLATDVPDFSVVTSMFSMFANADLANPDTSNWNTASVTNMRSMFYLATSANPDTSGWNTAAVTTMRTLFYRASSARPDTSGWDTSLVENMSFMFAYAGLANPDTSGWDTSKVLNMAEMFRQTTIANPDTSNWVTSSVTDMSYMFDHALAFNQDIGSWDVSQLTNATKMFAGATLSSVNYDSLLIGWNAQVHRSGVSFDGGNSVYCSAQAVTARANLVANSAWLVTDGGQLCPVMPADPVTAPDLTPATDTGVSNSDDITSDNTPRFEVQCSAIGNIITLYTNNPIVNTPIGSHSCFTIGAEIATVSVALNIGAHNIAYTDKILRKESGLSPQLTVTIVQALPSDDFVTAWKTDNPGRTNNTSVEILTRGGSYDVDWNNDGVFDQFNLVGPITHDYGVAGTYTIRIRGAYTSIYFGNDGDNEKLLSLDQWGTKSWTSMESAFYKAKNLNILAVDIPDFSVVTNMESMFSGATSANPDTSGWDTAAVTNMGRMFNGATSANPDTSGWDTAAVTYMGQMFWGATSANPDTSGWDTAAVTNMGGMFNGATSANPDTSIWDTAAVTSMSGMFIVAASANPDTSNWDTSAVLFMNQMFAGTTSANPDTSSWDTSAVTTMYGMFWGATTANPDTSGWDTSAVTNMRSMFKDATSANPDTSSWNTSSVTDMREMFANAIAFDQDLGSWDLRALTDATEMFRGVTLSTVNYDNLLIGWDAQIFHRTGTSFSGGNSVYCTAPAIAARANLITNYLWVISDGGQACPTTPLDPIVAPDLTPATDTGVSNSDNLTTDNTPRFYVICSASGNVITLYTDNPVANTAVGSYLCKSSVTEIATISKALVIGNHNISYTDQIARLESGQSPPLTVSIDPPAPTDDFVTTWITNRPGSSNTTSIMVPMIGGPYSVDWDNDGTFDEFNLYGPVTHDFGVIGTYTIRIHGHYSAIRFYSDGDNFKIASLDQWGTNSWVSMEYAFWGASYLKILANDTPDFSAVASMFVMFGNATLANPDVSGWDTSFVRDMSWMFWGATSFNQDIGSWDVASLRFAENMFEDTALSTINYESLLIGWNAQALQPGVYFGGGNSVYCSAAANAARGNMSASDTWIITDGGQGCPAAPATPVFASDLTQATDTGVSNSDNITANSSPEFEVICSAIGNFVILYTNIPVVNTAIGIHVCTSIGAEIAATTAVLIDGIHTISYIDQNIGERSGHSPPLVISVDTIAPSGPGSLTGPSSPVNEVNADIVGTCGADAGNGAVVVTTSAPNGFTVLYNTSVTLDANGDFSIVNPYWSEGTFSLNFECSDVAGNTTTLGPFGPILVDLPCSGTDTVVTGVFPAGMYLCAGTNSLITSGNVNLEAGAVVYLQSPAITLNPGLNVNEGASLISSSIIGPVAPLLLGPTTVKVSVGEILDFSESHICEDYEDGVLPITPFDTGVLVESTEPEVFTLSCTGLDGVITQMDVRVIKQ
ncbi:MAG: BspA family leucine-rich repeat surface protein [Proteobacteria bacterium]|nr:BspA family leucine-rich repeat surface protein [Pseudomonadota bacterium]